MDPTCGERQNKRFKMTPRFPVWAIRWLEIPFNKAVRSSYTDMRIDTSVLNLKFVRLWDSKAELPKRAGEHESLELRKMTLCWIYKV